MKKLISAAAVLGAVCVAGPAGAAGFQIDVLSGRGTGMAAAMTANVDDASSIFYNPAGMARGEHFDIELGDTLIIPSFTFTPASGGSSFNTEGEVIPPPHVYFSYGATDDITFGIGEFSEYGSQLSWPDGSPPAFVAQHVTLQTFNINPSVAFRLGDRVRVGVGVQVVRSVVELRQNLNFLDLGIGSVDLGASAWGAGGNIGVQVDILPKMLTLGVHYRSQVSLNFDDGKAHFDNVPVEFATQLQDQPGTTEITLPDTVQLGVSFKPVDSLTLSFDADYTAWQHMTGIALAFQDPSLSQTSVKNWHHTWNYHLGAEYALSSNLTLRAGVLYDPTPSPQETVAPDLPDSTRVNIALGGGYKVGGFKVDLGYQLVLITTNSSTFAPLPGDYKGIAHVVALTLGFGK